MFPHNVWKRSTQNMHTPKAKSPSKLAILYFICGDGGMVRISDLCDQNFFANRSTANRFLESHPEYFRLERKSDGVEVRVHTSAEVCCDYNPDKDDCFLSRCNKIHLCKHLVTASCKFGNRCKSSHDLRSRHNIKVLRTHRLEELNDEIILQLFKNTCVEHTVPDVCTYYNSTKGGCKNAEKCPFLHVCLHYIKGDCKFSRGCRFSHNILDRQPREVLKKFGIDMTQDPMNLVRMVRFKKQTEDGDSDFQAMGRKHLQSKKRQRSRSPAPATPMTAVAVKRKRQTTSDIRDVFICVFNLAGTCNYANKCVNLHTKEPFQWQYKDNEWNSFQDSENLEIEKAFCKTKSCVSVDARIAGRVRTWNIDFEKEDTFSMECESWSVKEKLDVRRIAPRFESQGWKRAFSTSWQWFWKDDDKCYVEYGKEGLNKKKANIKIATIEEAYRKFRTGDQLEKIHFGTGNQTGMKSYEINFKTRKQVNLLIGSERKIKRRPEFARKTDVKERAKRYKDSDLSADTPVPDTWNLNPNSQSDEGFQLSNVSQGSDQYRTVELKFKSTMTNSTIISVEKIQNRELWDDFCRKRKRMEKKLVDGSKVQEELLFHGTTESVVSAICQQNFDHRLSGTRSGAAYGQGSYFHKNARYSDGYAKLDFGGQKKMFVARVLVGSFTSGSSHMRRPPPKNPAKPLEDFHDACVDNISNPGIYVIFENNQVYPEFLITYR